MSSLIGGIIIGTSAVGLVLNLLSIRSMEKVILLFMLEQCVSGLGDVSRLYFLKLHLRGKFINKTYFSNVHLYLKAEKTPLNHIISDQLIIEMLTSILGEIEGVLMIVNHYVNEQVMFPKVVVVAATAYILLGMFY